MVCHDHFSISYLYVIFEILILQKSFNIGKKYNVIIISVIRNRYYWQNTETILKADQQISEGRQDAYNGPLNECEHCLNNC